MKDQIVMSPYNAEVAIAVPLFRIHHEQEITKLEGYSVTLTNEKPLAYVIQTPDDCQVMSSEFVENSLIFLGEL